MEEVTKTRGNAETWASSSWVQNGNGNSGRKNKAHSCKKLMKHLKVKSMYAPVSKDISTRTFITTYMAERKLRK